MAIGYAGFLLSGVVCSWKCCHLAAKYGVINISCMTDAMRPLSVAALSLEWQMLVTNILSIEVSPRVDWTLLCTVS